MSIQEQIKNLSDKELLEKYKNKDEYFQNVQELLEKEVSERKLLSKEEILQDKESKSKTTNNSQNKMFLFFLYVLIGIFIISVMISSNKNDKGKIENVQIKQRIYDGEYVDKIDKKYPHVMPRAEEFRQTILKSIVRKEETEDKNNFYTKYFDKEGRQVYSITRSKYQSKVGNNGVKSSSYRIEVLTPEEIGYVYDDRGRIIKSSLSPSGIPYQINKYSKENFYSFLEKGGDSAEVTDISYPNDSTRIEKLEIISLGFWQSYVKIEKIYKNNVLMNEKTIRDVERKKSGFIIATVEKKYNEKGELIYKTVERKDKTNDYKSFTEMDFAKDEIVTKYYKGKDVFATVTENLVGPVETIEETEMVKGEKIKKVYKNKVKAIVKRQRVGEPVKIVDVIEYVPKEIREKNNEKYGNHSIQSIRYIFNDNGNILYSFTGMKRTKDSFLYNEASIYPYSMEDGYLHEIFFNQEYISSSYSKYYYRINNVHKYTEEGVNIEYVLPEKKRNDIETKMSLGIIEENELILKQKTKIIKL